MPPGICLANLFKPRPCICFGIGFARVEKAVSAGTQRSGAALGKANDLGDPRNYAASFGSKPPECGLRIRRRSKDISPIRSAQVHLRDSISLDWTGRSS